jgi:hypothetical protein
MFTHVRARGAFFVARIVPEIGGVTRTTADHGKAKQGESVRIAHG